MLLVNIITRGKYLVLSSWLLALCLSVSAQENSPRSRYGLGDIVPTGNIINRSMGGVAAPYFDYQSVNFLNPAAYSKLRVTTFDLGFEVDSRVLRQTNPTDKFNSGTANVSYVQLGIPIMPKKSWGMNFGLRPNTRISYKIQTNERLPGIDSVSTLFEGNGGSYEAVAGTGIAFKNFSIGFNAGYLFGTKDLSSRRIFLNDTVFYYTSSHNSKTTFGGFSFSAGTQYSIKLAKATWLRLGATGQMQKTYKAQQDSAVMTFSYDPNGASLTIDSVYGTKNVPGDLVYPASYSFGFLLDKELQWSIGAEFRTSQWANYRLYGQNDNMRNAWQLSVGGQWSPDQLGGKNYWSRVTYRAGFYYGKDNVKVESDIPLIGFTAGAALPVRRNVYTNQFTVVNTAFEFGKRGGNNNLIIENFFRVSIGLSLSDLWFQKKKYY